MCLLYYASVKFVLASVLFIGVVNLFVNEVHAEWSFELSEIGKLCCEGMFCFSV